LLLGQAAHLPHRVRRKAYGLANDIVGSRHGTNIHRNGDARFSAPGEVSSQPSKVEASADLFCRAERRSAEGQHRWPLHAWWRLRRAARTLGLNLAKMPCDGTIAR
jgi:hypothetical protein